MKILYITRTFGPVGGMERYAFEVAREMVRRGHQVSALCRSVDESSLIDCGVEVIKLSTQLTKRGWEDRYVFRDAVTRFLATQKQSAKFDIVHSHENTIGQHVTTEHGPCTARGLRLKPWKYLDYSACKNLAIEADKFRSPSLRVLVSCSQRVQDIVIREYPFLVDKITQVITPAYSHLQHVTKAPARNVRILGFMGADWRRKGLEKAIDIFRFLRRGHSSWSMLIAGCHKDSLSPKLRRSLPEGLEFLGRVDPQDFFGKIHLLLHPASEEPFGMVISEALSCGVPVLCSDQCGAAQHLTCDGLRVLSLKDTISVWAVSSEALIGHKFPALAWRSWSDVGCDYETLYRKVCHQ